MENVNIQEILDQFKKDHGITLTQEQAKEYIAFIEKKLEAQPKPEKASDELSDEEAEGVAGGGYQEELTVFYAYTYCPTIDGYGFSALKHVFMPLRGFPNVSQCGRCGMVIDNTVDIEQLKEKARRA